MAPRGNFSSIDDKSFDSLHNESYPALSTDNQENTEDETKRLSKSFGCRISLFNNLKESPIPSKLNPETNWSRDEII